MYIVKMSGCVDEQADLLLCYSKNVKTFFYHRGSNFLNQSQVFHSISLVVRKPVFGVSDQIRHKPGCVVTEDV